MLNAIFVKSDLARARNSAIAAILLLFVFAGFVYAQDRSTQDLSDAYNSLRNQRQKFPGSQTPISQTQGAKDWGAGAKQVTDLLGQLRQQAQGVPGAMQYVTLAEKLWKQAQAQWAMQQRYQQQGMMNQMLAEQQKFLNNLNKQRQFLQEQLAFLNTPLKQRMDEDNMQHFGRLLQPDMNAKGGPAMHVWEKAKHEIDSIFGASSSASSQTPNKKGAWDNPFANDPKCVVDLSGSKTLTPELLREDNSKQFGNTTQAGRPPSLVGNVPPPEIPSADYVANQYVLLNSKEWPTKLKPLVEIGATTP